MQSSSRLVVVSGFAGAGKTALITHALASSPTHDLELFECAAGADPAFAVNRTSASSPSPDALVTVVDATAFLRDCASLDDLSDRGLARSGHDVRTVAAVLLQEIEIANLLVLNKLDSLDACSAARLVAVLRLLNPQARIVGCTHGRVDRRVLLDPALVAPSTLVPGWKLLVDDRRAAAPPDRHGVGSFVYRARRPFHPARWLALVAEPWHGVLRASGVFWIATRMDEPGHFSQSGSSCAVARAGRWWTSTPRREWPTNAASLGDIYARFEVPYGDRRQALAFIGAEMNEPFLRARLDACLLDDREMALGVVRWRDLPDPFFPWSVSSSHADGAYGA